MPNRYVRESAIESELVNSICWQGEVFWRRLVNRVDDFGRYTANPALLRASIFPLQLEKVREADISRLLAECEEAGLLFVYSAGNKKCLVLNKWEKGRAINSEYPDPPEDVCKRMQTFVYTCKRKKTNVPDSDSDTDSDTDSNSGTDTASVSTGFGVFWDAYPKKAGKGAAEKAFKSAIKITTVAKMVDSISAQKKTDQWMKEGGQFIPNPATWLNRKQWDDQIQKSFIRAPESNQIQETVHVKNLLTFPKP